jgi:hypothetical protein
MARKALREQVVLHCSADRNPSLDGGFLPVGEDEGKTHNKLFVNLTSYGYKPLLGSI